MDLQIQLGVFEVGAVVALLENSERTGPPTNHRINKIPKYLYQVNEQAYTPKVTSIGPVHHANSNLRAIEKYKQRYLERFIERTGSEDLRCIIREMKDEIRDIYKEITLKY